MKFPPFLMAIIAAAFLPQLAVAQLPTGTWKVNGNGFEGELIINTAEGGKVEGTIYGQPLVGTYDETTKQFNFLRLQYPKDPTSFQAWKGYFFQNGSEKEVTYTIAGTILPFGAPGTHAGMLEAGWYAQLTKAKE